MKFRFTAICAGLALCLSVAPTTWAQEDEENQDEIQSRDRVIEEVIVTATYRDTALMDTPISITTLTEEMLIDKGVINIQTLYQSIPGLAYRTNSNTYNNVSVRGLTSPGGGTSVVSVYVDDVPVTDGTSNGVSQIAGALFDLARVEVLKGPQGTLYGEGSMGGALRYITNDPDPNNYEFKINGITEAARRSNDLSYRARLLANIPLLRDRLGLRLSGFYRNQGGLLDITAPRDEEDVDTHDEEGVRAKMLWLIGGAGELSLMYNYLHASYGGPANASFEFGSDVLNDPLFGKNGGDDTQQQANLTFKWDLPFAQLTSSTSYYDRDVNFAEQTSPRFAAGLQGTTNFLFCGLATPACDFTTAPLDAIVTSLGGHRGFARQSERVIQEVRLVSNAESRWSWVSGLYYKSDESTTGTGELSFDYGLRPQDEALRPIISGFWSSVCCTAVTQVDTTEAAWYGEVSYAFNDQWELMAGARLANTKRDIRGREEDVDDTKVSPKVTLTWRPNDMVMVFGTVSQGFRPGLINTGLANEITDIEDAAAAGTPFVGGDAFLAEFSDRISIDGDEVLNYELGLKTTLLDGTLTLVTSAYYLDWKDTFIGLRVDQDDRVTPAPLGDLAYNDNVGEAHSFGFDMEVTWLATDDLTLSVGGFWNPEAEIDVDGPVGQFSDIDGNPVSVEKGNRLANAPKYDVNASVSYQVPSFAGWGGKARLDWYRVPNTFNRVTNEQETPGYYLTNVKFIATSPNGNLRAALYVDNLTDSRIIYEHNEVGFRFGRPRTVGLDLTWSL